MIKKALAVSAILLTVSAQAQSRICVNRTTGALNIRTACPSTEYTVTNVSALKGATGVTGARGAQGLIGQTGARGTAGLAGAVGMKGDKGDPGANVDMTKCYPAILQPDTSATCLYLEDPFTSSTIVCNDPNDYTRVDRNAFLQSWHWEQTQEGRSLYELGTLVQSVQHIDSDNTKPISSAGAILHLFVSGNWCYDPYGYGTCCPLPQ